MPAATSLSLDQPSPFTQGQTTSGEILTRAELERQAHVLFFYPAANTPGCTQETRAFGALAQDFAALGVRVIGISPDGLKKQQNFAAKLELPFTLIADPEGELLRAFDVWHEKKNFGKTYMGVVRSTFLIDAQGQIRALWSPVKLKDHVQEVLQKAASLG